MLSFFISFCRLVMIGLYYFVTIGLYFPKAIGWHFPVIIGQYFSFISFYCITTVSFYCIAIISFYCLTTISFWRCKNTKTFQYQTYRHFFFFELFLIVLLTLYGYKMIFRIGQDEFVPRWFGLVLRGSFIAHRGGEHRFSLPQITLRSSGVNKMLPLRGTERNWMYRQ